MHRHCAFRCMRSHLSQDPVQSAGSRAPYVRNAPGASPSSRSAAAVDQATTSARLIVVPWATTWSASPSSSDRIRHAAPPDPAHANDAGRDPGRDRPLQQRLPLEVEPPRRRLDGGTASRLGPGIEPELERPVLVGRRVGPEERPATPRPATPASAISRADSSRSCVRDLLERRREHVVHRLEVVMDQARRRAHRARPRRGPSSTPGPSRRPRRARPRRSPRDAGRAPCACSSVTPAA